MQNKKILIEILLVLTLFYILIFSSGVLAHEQSNKEKAGITPDSFLWNFDRAGEKIQLSLAFNIDKETGLRLKIADERLAEIEIMLQENKTKAAEKAEKVRENEINEIEKLSVGLSNETKNNIQESLQKHILVLEQVKEKAPEQAKQGIENAINQSSKVLEKFRFEEGQGGAAIPVAGNESGSVRNAVEPQGPAGSIRIITGPAPDWILEKGKEQIVSYVGEDYYNEHIFVKDALRRDNRYYIYYYYKFKVRGDANETSTEFTLWFDLNGNLVSPYSGGLAYPGPTRPYLFNISRAEVVEIARELGMNEPTNPVVVSGYDFRINESYTWLVITAKYEYKKPKRIYLDVDFGNIIFTENETTLILTEEQKALIEEIIRKEYPYVVERLYLAEAYEVLEEPNQLKVFYFSQSAIPESPGAIIIVNLENKTIISIEKYFWD